MYIQFECGKGKFFKGPVNILISQSGGKNCLRVYAECRVPKEAKDDYGYLAMKKAILADMTKLKIDTNDLRFWYDGEEKWLSDEASVNCEVYVNIEKDDCQ